jgi:hypothetical protein
LAALMTDDHRFVDSAGHVTSGRPACIAAWTGFFEAFPDYRNHFRSMADEGDGRVVARGHSACSEAALDGPAIWTASVVGGSVAEWRVDEPPRVADVRPHPGGGRKDRPRRRAGHTDAQD